AEEIFESNCASCHGGDLSGGAGPDLTAVGADHSSDEIKDIIENGVGSMPAQEQVSEDDATTLSDWLAEKKYHIKKSLICNGSGSFFMGKMILSHVFL